MQAEKRPVSRPRSSANPSSLSTPLPPSPCFFVKSVMVLPERALFSRTLGGVGRQVRIIVDVREMEVVQVHQPGFDVGFLYFEGRTTGPVLATGSEEVAEIGDGHGGIRRA